MSKKKYVNQEANKARKELTYTYANKYYNLFMNEFSWEGISTQAQDYIMRKFWENGTIAVFKIKNTGEPGFAEYAGSSYYNQYDFPEKVNILNPHNIPWVPSKNEQVVNKDVVIGWITPNHKGIRILVDNYIRRMVAVDMVIRTNLNTHKLPWSIAVSPEDKDTLEDIMDKVMNDESVIYLQSQNIGSIKTLNTNTPYIIDKLNEYKNNIESELLNILGIDNSPVMENRMLVDQVNANNNLINANLKCMLDGLKAMCKDAKEYLGLNIDVKSNIEKSYSERLLSNGMGEESDEETM